MKKNFAVILVSALLPVACGQGNLDQYVAAAQAAISSSDQAANQLYLDDVSDSAADTTTASTTTTTDSTTASTTTDSSSTVKDDIKEERLVEMVKMVMTELDTDSSGSLTLAEFLVGPKKRADDTAVDADVAAKMTAKMTEDFNTYAGDDALLSSDELKTLLKAVAPRVGHHRGDKFPGAKQEERVKESAAEVIAKYDTDGDGKLSADEFEAMETARKAEMKDFRDKNSGSDQGNGPQGKQGPGHGGPSDQGPNDDQP